MHSQFLNEIEIELKLTVEGPLLIREGRLGDQVKGEEEKNWKEYHEDWIKESPKIKEEFPNAFFVFLNPEKELEQKIRSGDTNPKMDFYVPGSSIRGVFRSHLEKMVQSVSPDGKSYACNPFDESNDSPTFSCNERLGKKSEKVNYTDLCVICKLFGTTQFKTRLFVSDGIIEKYATRSLRDGIAIDRFTGGVKTGHNYKLQVLENTEILTKIRIVNFEKWQLGLLAFLFRDLEEELLFLGSGKSRGFGKMKGRIHKVTFRYFCNNPDFLKGIEDLDVPLKKLNGNLKYNWKNGWEKNNEAYLFENIRMKNFSSVSSIVEDDFWRWCAEYWLACLKQSKETKDEEKKIFLTIDELKNKAKG